MSEILDELMDALFEAFEQFGLTLTTGQQVAVARDLAAKPPTSVTPTAVAEAMRRQGIANPPLGIGAEVIGRWRAYGQPPSLLDLLLEYRQWAIDALSAEHGGKKKSEDTLRNNLRAFIPKRAHVETRTGRGKTDIYIPDFNAVIEVKVWTDQSTFDEGVEELGRYIRTSKPDQAFMVVFGDRRPLPKIVADPDQALAETLELGGLVVPVVVVVFENDYPSTARREERKRAKSGTV